jgi:hypothetical protein
VELAASSSQAHLAQSLALAQARSEVPSVPRYGDEMFLAWFGVIVLACMIWVVLDVNPSAPGLRFSPRALLMVVLKPSKAQNLAQ